MSKNVVLIEQSFCRAMIFFLKGSSVFDERSIQALQRIMTPAETKDIVSSDRGRSSCLYSIHHSSSEEFTKLWLKAVDSLMNTDQQTIYIQGQFDGGCIGALSMHNIIRMFKLLGVDSYASSVNMIRFSTLDSKGRVLGIAFSYHNHPDFSSKVYMLTIIENAEDPNLENRRVTTVLPAEITSSLFPTFKERQFSKEFKSMSANDMRSQLLQRFSRNDVVTSLLQAIWLPSGEFNLEICRSLVYMDKSHLWPQVLNEDQILLSRVDHLIYLVTVWTLLDPLINFSASPFVPTPFRPEDDEISQVGRAIIEGLINPSLKITGIHDAVSEFLRTFKDKKFMMIASLLSRDLLQEGVSVSELSAVKERLECAISGVEEKLAARRQEDMSYGLDLFMRQYNDSLSDQSFVSLIVNTVCRMQVYFSRYTTPGKVISEDQQTQEHSLINRIEIKVKANETFSEEEEHQLKKELAAFVNSFRPEIRQDLQDMIPAEFQTVERQSMLLSPPGALAAAGTFAVPPGQPPAFQGGVAQQQFGKK